MRTKTNGGRALWMAVGIAALCGLAISACAGRKPVPDPIPTSYMEPRYLAHAIVSVPVDDIYRKALQFAEDGNAKHLKILCSDPTSHRIEVSNGTQTAVFSAERLDVKYTWITIMADGLMTQEINPKEENSQEPSGDPGFEMVANLCKAIGIECAILKKARL